MDAPVSALDLAEKYNYPALVRAVQLQPMLAHDVDDYGMTPLHWVCSDPRVPLAVLQKLVLVHPPATMATNLAGLLPLHIALRKNLPLDSLKLLLKFYPNAITVATPDGRTPLELANEHVTAPSAKLFLQLLDAEVRALDRVAAKNKHKRHTSQTNKHEQLRAADTIDDNNHNNKNINNNNNNEVEVARRIALPETPRMQSTTPVLSLQTLNTLYRDPIDDFLASPSMRAAATTQRPPTWKLAKHCHLCECKFSYFKSRHHCRNCGESVCSRHSRHALPLRHIGLFAPQRVCAACHEQLQHSSVGCNTNESSQSSRAHRSRAAATGSSSNRFSVSRRTAIGGDGVGRESTDQFEQFDAFDDTDEDTNGPSSTRSLFWSPATISPRMFRADGTTTTANPQHKRSNSTSARNYLVAASPRRMWRTGSTTSDSGAASPLPSPLPSPALSVRSQRSQQQRAETSTATASGRRVHNGSHATLASMPLFPTAPSLLLSRVRHELHAPSLLVQNQNQMKNHTTSGSTSDSRRLQLTDLDDPMQSPWYEAMEQQPLPPSLADPQHYALDSRVSELEAHVQQLRTAKRQIHAALKQSEQEVQAARSEKNEYDAIAAKYVADRFVLDGDASPPASPLSTITASGRSQTATVMTTTSPVADCAKLKLRRASVAVPGGRTNGQHQSKRPSSRSSSVTSTFSIASSSSSSETMRDRDGSNATTERSTGSDASLPPPPNSSSSTAMPIVLDVAATHHDLGVVLLGKNDFAGAAAAFRKALDLDATNALAWFHLAKALDGTGDARTAEFAVNKALALDSMSLASLSLLGRLLHLRGEHDEAIMVFRRALNLQCPVPEVKSM